MARRKNERAAKVLADAFFLGIERAAEKHDVSPRSVYNYRAALKKDEHLSNLFSEHVSEVHKQDWVAGLEADVLADIKQPEKLKERGAKRRDNRHVYFLGEVYGAVKIGVAVNLEKRIKTLQTAFPYKLTLIHSVQSDRANTLERELHKHFAAKRLNGEWFALNQEDIQWVKRMY